MVEESIIQIDKPQEMTQRREHALADMIPSKVNLYTNQMTDEVEEELFKGTSTHDQTSTHLGNLSASKTTQLTPSRTSAEAVYEPPGPPPITKTVVSSGTDIVCCAEFNESNRI